MKKYFISSDIHSFFDEWQAALKKAGFDIYNEEHIIVVLGDIFDRGSQPLQVYNFLKALPKERRILIRGNHEILLREMVKRGYSEKHDEHNGTQRTAELISGEEDSVTWFLILDEKYKMPVYNNKINYDDYLNSEAYKKYKDNITKEFIKRRKRIFNNEMLKSVLDWIYSDEWINYWETNKYIFVHSWIPLQKHIDFQKSLELGYFVEESPDTFREDWRNATQTEWEDATWPCPWKKAKEGLNKTGKTIVCGHWHTSDFFNNLTSKKKKVDDCPIFISKKYKLIGLDACTVVSKKVNCLVLTEDEL